MTTQPQPIPERTAYQETVSGLLRLHRYTVENRDETDEYHEICAALEDYWGQMTPNERDRTGGLSQDLYTVSDPPPAQIEPITAEAQGEFGAVYEARERGEWDFALATLRKLQKVVPAALVAYLRGSIWEGLGDKQVAVVFYDHANRLEPGNQGIQAAFLNVLKWTDWSRAMQLAEAVLAESDKLAPHLVVQAVEVLYGRATSLSEHDAVPIYRRLIGILTPLLERTSRGPTLESAPVSMIVLRLATCHRWLGEIPSAYHYYSLAIALEPWNAAILVARGIIVYGTDPAAISDLEQAIKLESPIVWPYFCVAHYLLTHGRFEDCRRMCEQALGKPAPERIQSELYEFLGISLTSLGYPVHVIQRVFENAIRVDPSNARARQNLQQFLAANSAMPQKPIPWEYASDSSVRSSGLQKMQTMPYRERRTYSVV
jgi:tetratricopeptide (TPR) repeat protein